MKWLVVILVLVGCGVDDPRTKSPQPSSSGGVRVAQPVAAVNIATITDTCTAFANSYVNQKSTDPVDWVRIYHTQAECLADSTPAYIIKYGVYFQNSFWDDVLETSFSIARGNFCTANCQTASPTIEVYTMLYAAR